MKAVASSLLAGACLLGVAGCDSPDRLIPDHTRTWLHETDGAYLRFGEPASGAVDTLRALRTESTPWVHHGKLNPGGYHSEKVELSYQDKKVTPGFGQAGALLDFYASGTITLQLVTTPSEQVGELTTSPSLAAELVSHPLGTIELLDNTTLNGHRYERVVHLWQQHPPTVGWQELWYSRQDGLVAYRPVGKKTYYRL